MLSEKVPYFIVDLLQQVPFVYVQGLGRFEAIFHPATIDLPQDRIKPPYIVPDFSLNGEASDEILAAYMHYVSGISKSAAEESIRAFVEKIKANTEEGKTYPIEKFGTFSTSDAGNLRFTPDWDAFNLSFSGLEAVDISPSVTLQKPIPEFKPVPLPRPIEPAPISTPAEPVEEVKSIPEVASEEQANLEKEKLIRASEIDEHTSRLWWMILTSALILIAVLCAYLAWDIISNRNKLNDLKQIYPDSTAISSAEDSLNIQDTTPIDVENIPIEEPVANEDTSAKGEAKVDIANPCFVVVGAFSDPENVAKMVTRLESGGYAVEKINGGNLIKVAIKTSCEPAELQKVLNDARSSINPEAWIY